MSGSRLRCSVSASAHLALGPAYSALDDALPQRRRVGPLGVGPRRGPRPDDLAPRGRTTCAGSAAPSRPPAPRSPCSSGRRPSRRPRRSSPRSQITYWPSGSRTASSTADDGRVDVDRRSTRCTRVGVEHPEVLRPQPRHQLEDHARRRVRAAAETSSPSTFMTTPSAGTRSSRRPARRAARRAQRLGLVLHRGHDLREHRLAGEPRAQLVVLDAVDQAQRQRRAEELGRGAHAVRRQVRARVVVAGDQAPQPPVAQQRDRHGRAARPCSSGTRCGSARRCAGSSA